jgi:hypothetical protein
MQKRYLSILQHTLGLDEYGRGSRYRNHFVTGERTDDYPICMELVEAGLMTRRVPPVPCGEGSCVFAVTKDGDAYIAANSPKPPVLTASQQRYRRYISHRDVEDISFIDFCRRDAHAERQR